MSRKYSNFSADFTGTMEPNSIRPIIGGRFHNQKSFPWVRGVVRIRGWMETKTVGSQLDIDIIYPSLYEDGCRVRCIDHPLCGDSYKDKDEVMVVDGGNVTINVRLPLYLFPYMQENGDIHSDYYLQPIEDNPTGPELAGAARRPITCEPFCVGWVDIEQMTDSTYNIRLREDSVRLCWYVPQDTEWWRSAMVDVEKLFYVIRAWDWYHNKKKDRRLTLVPYEIVSPFDIEKDGVTSVMYSVAPLHYWVQKGEKGLDPLCVHVAKLRDRAWRYYECKGAFFVSHVVEGITVEQLQGDTKKHAIRSAVSNHPFDLAIRKGQGVYPVFLREIVYHPRDIKGGSLPISIHYHVVGYYDEFVDTFSPCESKFGAVSFIEFLYRYPHRWTTGIKWKGSSEDGYSLIDVVTGGPSFLMERLAEEYKTWRYNTFFRDKVCEIQKKRC